MAGVLSKSKILEYTGGSEKGADILAASKKYGFKSSDVDKAFALPAGKSDEWLKHNTYSDGAVVEKTTPWYDLPGTKTAPEDGSAKTPISPVTSREFSTMTPSLVTVDPEKSTVQGQLTGVLAKGGPLMQRAATQGNQQANARGLLNSSIAVGAAENAVYDKALQIAQPDANTYWQAQTNNQSAANRAGEVNVDSTNQAARTDADTSMQELRGTEQAASDAAINQNNRVVSFNNAVAMITSNTNNIIANLRADSSIDPATRQGLIDQIMRDSDNQIQRLGTYNDIDTGDLLNFAPTTPTVNLSSVRDDARTASQTEQETIQRLYDAAVAQNMTSAQVAQQLGITTEKVLENLAKIGKMLPADLAINTNTGNYGVYGPQ